MHDAVPSYDSEAVLAKLWELTILISKDMERGLADRGISRSRADLLTRIYYSDEAPTQRWLADQHGVTPRNMTGLLDGLQRDGMITRSPHPTDRRATIVGMTDKGADFIGSMLTETHQIADGLFGELPVEERARFVATVDHVIARYRSMVASRDGTP
ncbi:MarR family winged helix-turn-helix transcriptional regulator [Antrihabitans cavernicola]|uniref:MarR family transcriptional regulator n=1 Tax=Antrihabitans cavernicola TaxID=2495913 RepID=A0A5A7S7Z1_9NOCA|nr:MarR family transcriptional regulator [Spelaeibacter cavernicola]KAA0019500.1 MarR family transcriptional regulator [Spelaeibacter cavernicola]